MEGISKNEMRKMVVQAIANVGVITSPKAEILPVSKKPMYEKKVL